MKRDRDHPIRRLHGLFMPAVLSIELRKIFTYRVDFWVQFLGGLLAQFGIAWFIWREIFASREVATIGGYSRSEMMLYYLLVPLLGRAIRGSEMGGVSQEIYEGTLTRYLVYPITFFGYKLTIGTAHTLVFLAQAVVAVWAVSFLPGQVVTLQWQHVVMATVAVAAAMVLYFTISAALELIAFWADNVWSLLVIVRFTTGLLGGGMLPLSLFPEPVQHTLRFLPFPYLANFPVRCLMGRVSFHEWLPGIGIMLCWQVIMFGLYAMTWERGKYRYTGVGI